jgi:hypothetical protein
MFRRGDGDLDAGLVRGSHGLPSSSPERGPLVMTQRAELLESDRIEATDVFGLVLEHLRTGSPRAIPRGERVV